MTPHEQKSIIEFIQSIVTADQPPMDYEADAIIRALFVRNPDAAYRVTVLAMTLQDTLKNTQALASHQPAGAAAAGSAASGLLGGLLRRWQAARGFTRNSLETKIS